MPSWLNRASLQESAPVRQVNASSFVGRMVMCLRNASREAAGHRVGLRLGLRSQDRDLVPRGGLGQRGEVRWSGRWRRQCEGLGRLADLGGELLEPGRGVQGEEPRGGGGDDIGVADTPGQHGDGAGPGGMFLFAYECSASTTTSS